MRRRVKTRPTPLPGTIVYIHLGDQLVAQDAWQWRSPFGRGTPWAARNEVKLVEGLTSHETGRSFAETGGRYAEIDVMDRFVQNGVVPHEFGHLGGLNVLYNVKTGAPDPAMGDGIMNRVPGVIDSPTIEGIINAESNIRRKER
jgi:hypothetical protein